MQFIESRRDVGRDLLKAENVSPLRDGVMARIVDAHYLDRLHAR